MAGSRAERADLSSGILLPKPRTRGVIALVRDGDRIGIDAVNNTIDVDLAPEEIAARRDAWTEMPLRVTSGALLKYARLVSSASEGCTTDRS